jgi:hypothetical protein
MSPQNKASIKTDFAAWLARVNEMSALIREDRVADAHKLAPSVFLFAFPTLARIFNDPAATPTEADFRDYQAKCRLAKLNRRKGLTQSGEQKHGGRRDERPHTSYALSPLEDCLKMTEKPPGMSDARWRMIQSYKKNRAHYDAQST